MRKRKILAVFIVVATVLMTTFTFYGYQILKSPNILVEQEDRLFFIHEGDSFDDVRNNLYQQNYLNDIISFSFLSKLMDYDVSVKPGRYVLKANMNNLEAIRLLRSGSQDPTTITFNNVRLRQDLAGKITQNIAVDSVEFLAAMDAFAANNDRGLDTATSMILFIPNTYQVYWTITAEDLIDRMGQEYDRFWNEDRKSKAAALGMSQLEVSILASIVQAEVKYKDEAGRIAGLYVNRLNRGIPLQADPTVVFAVGDFGLKRVLKVHTEVDSPYNTYRNRGLPPGPINLPEIYALDAVLNHEQHQFIYMCAREDFSGYHNFATNLQDHNVNAAKYQRALSIEQRKARMNSQ